MISCRTKHEFFDSFSSHTQLLIIKDNIEVEAKDNTEENIKVIEER